MKTVKDYNLPLNSLKQQHQHEIINTVLFCQVSADTVKAKQNTAEYGRRQCLFAQSNKLTFDFLTLKVVSESRVTWATSVPIFWLPRPLCSRLRPDVRDRQTYVRRQTASSLYAFAY